MVSTALMLPAQPAEAQSRLGGALVSNIGQSDVGGINFLTSRLQAQGFTTGDHASGYGLMSIEVDTSAVGAPAGVRVELWSAASDGTPDAKLGNLTVPSTISSGATTFAAPTGTWLRANTTYFVVLYRASGSGGTMRTTDATTEDSGAASGWSLQNQYWRASGGAWTSSAPRIKIRVNGAIPYPWPEGTRHQSERQVWSTTMSAKNLEPTRWGTNSSGCKAGVSGGTCPVAMGSNSFTYAGNTYAITDFYHRDGTLSAGLRAGSAAAIDAAKSLMLIVKYAAGAERRFPLRNLTASGISATASWPVDDMRWGSYGKPHSDPQRNPAVWGAYDAGVTLAVVEVPEPVTVTVTSPAARTHTVTVSVPTAVAQQTTISLSTYGRVGHRVQTDLRDPDLISHCDPIDPWDPVFLNSDRKYPFAYIQAGQRSTTFNLCIMEVPHDVANQTLTSQVTVYHPWGKSSVTYDINVGSANVGSSGAAEFRGGEGPGSGEEQQRDPLTAAFEDVPETHDGTEFAFSVRLSETVGRFSRSPRPSSFAVTGGRVMGVEQIGAGLWRVKVRPASPSAVVTVTLAGGRNCDHEPSGAVCARDGRALSNTSHARVAADPQQQQAALTTPEPADVSVVPGDGSLTVRWTAVAHPRLAAERVQHALRWSQQAGVWANPQGNNGVAVQAGVNSYTITGLENGVATGVFVRAFVGGLRSEHSEHSSEWVRVKGEPTTPRAAQAQTVAVAFGKIPAEHDGRTAFALDVQSGAKPAADAFTVTNGTITGVESLDPVLWRVRVKPKSWKDVTVALGDASAKVPGPARIRVADARAKEGKHASLDFTVTLSRAASGPVSVHYATNDGTATTGADYTAASGTLTFAPGETHKTISVTLLDDAINESKETLTLKLSNPQGAFLRAMHRNANGIIKNDDP
ncbi:choice-of-anchor R domain-containing protein [Candidatus Poriferisodalis sp.]|uniref:choice-of-anchor R domain-containing protein n=1 Tax=Candidatus Poriferisodalis sp. TaxID=3101277 RepID=UPI003B013796